MGLFNSLILTAVSNPVLTAVLLFLVPSLLLLTYNVFLHPLARYPGPLAAKISPLWSWYHAYRGTEASAIQLIHLRHAASIVRISPNALSISSSDAIKPIYITKGGLKKPSYYSNFSIDGHDTIFGTQDAEYRSRRAKAVVDMFAPAKVRQSFEQDHAACRSLVSQWIRRLKHHKNRALSATGPSQLDLNDECRRVSIDIVSTYLFGQTYGAMREDSALQGKSSTTSSNGESCVMSASGFVDEFVSVGRLFRLPPPVFKSIMMAMGWLYPSLGAVTSIEKVHDYAASLSAVARPGQDTYQSRLLYSAGISESETTAQMQDLMFAGTDSTATALASILFHLIRKPQLLRRLKKDLSVSKDRRLLDAVVKEGLRVSMPNPTRLPRLVPPGAAVRMLGETIPGGTEVGCSSWCLHHDPNVFHNPFDFNPERWLQSESGSEKDNEIFKMTANMFPFSAGSRQCIARNLAQEELLAATDAVTRSGVLEGCETAHDKIGLVEWFNSKMTAGSVDILWHAS